MCRACNPLSRRALLRSTALGTVIVAGASVGTRPSAAAALLTKTPTIRPRSAWAGSSCPVRGTLQYEPAGAVKFLLVHHSETTSSYPAAQVPRILRSFYRTHVGKGWPDIAYNFLVDRYGRIWEGRADSLRHPTIASATGGSQGFSQIVCWVGNHRVEAPTAAARQSMISLLAWLSRRYAVDTTPGATVRFVSRGSNRWPAGVRVSTRTIEGHRRMSMTDCPGDAAYSVVRETLPLAVRNLNAS